MGGFWNVENRADSLIFATFANTSVTSAVNAILRSDRLDLI